MFNFHHHLRIASHRQRLLQNHTNFYSPNRNRQSPPPRSNFPNVLQISNYSEYRMFINSEKPFFYLTNLGFKLMHIHIKFHQNTSSHNHVILPKGPTLSHSKENCNKIEFK
ncbi:hypothetical protein V8G54_032619 [Vigna mungo]|uniref:Uncharacterized protein n=1 Tax=Vigna mungo TaxID=3915 RepID=A0AAQ3MMC1_VIGMU